MTMVNSGLKGLKYLIRRLQHDFLGGEDSQITIGNHA